MRQRWGDEGGKRKQQSSKDLVKAAAQSITPRSSPESLETAANHLVKAAARSITQKTWGKPRWSQHSVSAILGSQQLRASVNHCTNKAGLGNAEGGLIRNFHNAPSCNTQDL